MSKAVLDKFTGIILNHNHVNLGGDTMTGLLQINTPNSSTKGLIIQGSGNIIFLAAVDYYKLDEATAIAAVDSIGSITLADTGTTVVTGILGNARSFNGTSDYLNASSAPIIAATNWSIQVWVKAGAVSQASGLMVYNGNDGGGMGFGIGDGNGGTGNKLVGLCGGVAWMNTNFVWPDTTTWHHVVMTRDTTTITIYFDGVSKGTFATVPQTPNAQVAVGMEPSNVNAATRFFNGSIDEVGFWNATLTSAQVTSLYNSGNALALSAAQTVNLQEWQAPGGGIVGSMNKLGAYTITPVADSATILVVKNAAGSNVFIIDTINSRVGVGVTPTQSLDISGNFNMPTSSSTVGVITQAGTRYIHNVGTNSFYAGLTSGTLTNTAGSNVGIGAFALQRVTSGGQNVGVGYQALQNITTTADSVGIGHNALQAATGGGNLGMGSFALFAVTSGTSNTAIGYQAGYPSGTNGVTTATNNTFIGANSGFNSSTQYTGSTVIGANALVGASNTFVLGLNVNVIIGGTTGVAGNGLTIQPVARTSGTNSILTVTGPVDTGQTIAEQNDVNINLARTSTFAAGGGTIASQRAFLLQAPTYAATTNAVTLTNAATLAISGAPVASTNITITNNYALWIQGGNVGLAGLVSLYNNVSTAGWGVPGINGYGRLTAQTGAVASVAAYTVGAADGSFIVSANVLITAFTAGTISVVVTYTDEGNTARSLTMNVSSITGVLGTTIGAAGAFEGVPLHLRAKASTAITVTTTVSVFTGTYNVEGAIQQIA